MHKNLLKLMPEYASSWIRFYLQVKASKCTKAVNTMRWILKYLKKPELIKSKI
uniref:Uncharacterized protein n=1 Tax=Timema bartmani TaxID=61472 RepID=A0A7R9I7P4_9NEOP|nr:unnamed protein product [Timema bartmani]